MFDIIGRISGKKVSARENFCHKDIGTLHSERPLSYYAEEVLQSCSRGKWISELFSKPRFYT